MGDERGESSLNGTPNRLVFGHKRNDHRISGDNHLE